MPRTYLVRISIPFLYAVRATDDAEAIKKATELYRADADALSLNIYEHVIDSAEPQDEPEYPDDYDDTQDRLIDEQEKGIQP